MALDLSPARRVLNLLKVCGFIATLVISGLFALYSWDGVVRARVKTCIVTLPVIPWHGTDYRYWIPHEYRDNLINTLLFASLFLLSFGRLTILTRRQYLKVNKI